MTEAYNAVAQYVFSLCIYYVLHDVSLDAYAFVCTSKNLYIYGLNLDGSRLGS
jgi:hypothetical protein